MDYALIWDRLVPGTQYEGTIGTPTFKWLDSRTQPTEAECAAEWTEILQEQAIAEANAQAYATYMAGLSAGYDYNGRNYSCSDQFTTDLVKMVMLTELAPEEPVYLMDSAGSVHTMSVADFKTFAASIGYYVYGLRQTYWSALQ